MNINRAQLNYVWALPAFNKFLADDTKHFFQYHFFARHLFLKYNVLTYIYFFRLKTFILPLQRSQLSSGSLPKSSCHRTPPLYLPGINHHTLGTPRAVRWNGKAGTGRSVSWLGLYHLRKNGRGNFLGNFIDELYGDTICTFVSGKTFFYV